MQVYIWHTRLKKNSYQEGPNENALHGPYLWKKKKTNILQRINEGFIIGPILGIFFIRILIIVLELLFQCKVFLVIWLDHLINKVNAATKSGREDAS